MANLNVTATPIVRESTTISIEIPLAVAKTLISMFSYMEIADIYATKISGSAIPKADIQATIEQLKNGLNPALSEVAERELCRRAVASGKFHFSEFGGEVFVTPVETESK